MKSILYFGNSLEIKGSTPTGIDTLSILLECEGFTIYKAGLNKIKSFRFIEMVIKAFRNRKAVDYFIIDTYSTQAFWYAFFISQIARFLRVKYVIILRGGNLPFRLNKSKRASKLILCNSYKNIAVSKYLFSELSCMGYDVEIIPNNIEVNKYKFKERTKLSPKLLWVRSLHTDYNPLMAVDVLSQVIKKYPEAYLCMVGPDKDGSMERTKSYAKKLNIFESILLTGKLSKPHWHTLSEEYDIFINTTKYDNTPISVLEAMALGLPVVSTNVGGIPYLLEDKTDAILVESNKSEDMAKAIFSLIEHPDLATKLASSARKKAESYDWKVVKGLWINVLS